MIGLATQRVVVTEKFLAESMEEMSVLEDFLNLACLGASANPVEERVGLRRRISRRLYGCRSIIVLNDHSVLKQRNGAKNAFTAPQVFIALVPA